MEETAVFHRTAGENTDTEVVSSGGEQPQGTHGWQKWYYALKQVWPIYLATHIAFLMLTYLASLFTLDNFSGNKLGFHTLLQAWNRWDTGHFITIATQGYDSAWRTAFFPLYSILEAGLSFLTRDPFIAGLIISNIMALITFTVAYRLVEDDFGVEKAYRAVLYLALFPTVFFMAAAYNEALFLGLAILSFYNLRHGHWWWAGIFGFLAALTRSVGLFLLIPFAYEYLRQHHFKLRDILHVSILSSILIPAGIGIFSIYCAIQFKDPLAFSHAQTVWGRHLSLPGVGFISALKVIRHTLPISFTSVHNVIDLSMGLFILVITVLGLVGPWKFPKNLRVYGIYAAAIYLFLILFPATGDEPLQSLSRQLLEIFPVFIILAALGQKKQFNLYYLTLSMAMLCFMLLLFLTGRWMV